MIGSNPRTLSYIIFYTKDKHLVTLEDKQLSYLYIEQIMQTLRYGGVNK